MTSTSIAPLGLDPQQIRQQFAGRVQPDNAAQLSGETFSQVMWQTVLKESLDLKALGGGTEGLGGGMYGDLVKEGLTSAISAQLAKQSPLSLAPQGATGATRPNHE
ncbi:MAG: hypothetical protein ACLFR7_02740 [Opitutales bacterium]